MEVFKLLIYQYNNEININIKEIKDLYKKTVKCVMICNVFI